MLLAFAAIHIACSDIKTVQTGTLQITPDEVLFRAPDIGQRVSRSSVEVRNVGTAPIGIVGMRIEESDELVEIELVDGDDHQSERFLDPNEAEFIELKWTAFDALADDAQFVVLLADDSTVSIPVRTPDIDPSLAMTGDPNGMNTPDGLTVSFLNAPPGSFQKVLITLTSKSVAALVLDAVCLLEASGQCAQENQTGGFLLCAGNPVSPETCTELVLPQSAMNFEDEFIFTAFYEPAVDVLGRVSRDIRVSSNASDPTQVIRLVGESCERNTPSDVCGTCGDGQVDEGEQCDDGNIDEQDDCRNDCKTARCGDGVVQLEVEACDDGNADNTDGCLDTCQTPECDPANAGACDDSNPCTTDRCAPESGTCVYTPSEQQVCTPDTGCTPTGVCQDGQCVATPCDDTDPCTRDRCDEETMTCEYTFDMSLDPDACAVCEPQVEICDGMDNDCDDTIDEGVLNACGNCDDTCVPPPCEDTELFWTISADEMRSGASDATGEGACFGLVRFNGGSTGSTGSSNICGTAHCGTLEYGGGPRCNADRDCVGFYAGRSCIDNQCKRKNQYCTVRAECINGVPTATGFGW